MGKRKLNEVDISFITKNYKNKTAKEIANILPLGVGERTVQKYIDKNLAEETPSPAKSNVKNKRAGDSLARQDGVVVMTEEASEISDDARNTHTTKPLTEAQKQRSKAFIHQPFGD